jgi:hypothetical protein
VGVATQALDKTFPHFSDTNPLYNRWVSVVCFAMLGFSLYYFARKPIPSETILEEVEASE